MPKLRVAVIFGGRSGEHEVSLRSAESVIRALDRAKYDVVPVAITHEGRWLVSKEAPALPSPRESIESTLERGDSLVVAPEPSRTAFVDVVIPVLHGTYGEDGTIQGFLELANLPYVGAGVLGSAVGMDKDVMKRLLREAKLPIADFWAVRHREIVEFCARQGATLPYPVFVKPANLGSSVGITKVHDASTLEPALRKAAEFDLKLVVERGVDAREIELSVLGNNDPIASVPGEILPSREFYDYDAKYLDDSSELKIPAILTLEQTREAQRLAVATFRALECSGMGRVDLFLERGSGRFLVNEINTIPGFTSISMYPKLWEASGMSYGALLDRLIELALERHREKSALRTRYS